MIVELILHVDFVNRNGEPDDFLISKDYDFVARPHKDDRIYVNGDGPYIARMVLYDAETKRFEVWTSSKLDQESARRYISEGFKLLDTGGEVPEELIPPKAASSPPGRTSHD